MVKLKRLKGDIWEASADDPQELAAADTFMRGVRSNPDGFAKVDGHFKFVAEFPQLGEYCPWDEIEMGGFGKTFKPVP